MSRWFGWLLVMALFAVQALNYGALQPRIRLGGGRGDDGVTYGAVADAFIEGRSVHGPAPFVYRLGAPWLAARYAMARGVSVDRAFQETDTVLTIAVLTTIYVLALEFGSVLTAAVAASLFSLPWWSYTRLVWFYPVQVDMPWLLAMLLGLALIRRMGTRARALQVVGLLVLSAIASLSRETGLLLPVVWITTVAWGWFRTSIKPSKRDVVIGISLAVTSFVAFIVTRFVAQNTHAFEIVGEPFTFTTAALESLCQNTPRHLLWSVLLAWGGPLLGVFLVDVRATARLVDERPELFAFWLAVFLLAMVGGVNTLRFLSWASPVVFVLAAAMVRRSLNRRAGIALILHWLFLLGGLVVYLRMIRPFEGYFSDYTAWNEWGGLQSSPLPSLEQLVPCLLILAGIALSGQLVRRRELAAIGDLIGSHAALLRRSAATASPRHRPSS